MGGFPRIEARRWLALSSVAALLAVPGASHAGSDVSPGQGLQPASASLSFTLRVPRVRQVAVLDSPDDIEVTAEDLARGEKVIPGRLVILSNAREASSLQVSVVGPIFADLVIEGLDYDVRTAGGSAVVAVPSMVGKPRPAPRAVLYRVKLAPEAAQGRYPFPVRLALD